MTLLRWHRDSIKSIINQKKLFSSLINESEYTATPQYPPILDLSLEKRKERLRQTEHDKIKDVKTVEEKQIKLNMPRYYGFKTYMLMENYIPYDNLTLAQHVTRTHLIRQNELPKYYENIGVNNLAESAIKEQLIDGLLLEVEGYRRSYDLKKEDLSVEEIENLIGSNIVKQLNRIIMNHYSRTYRHLTDLQVDLDPRIEACWFCGGMEPTERVKSSRRGLDWLKDRENDPIDRLMNYIGNPYLTLRSTLPLPLVASTREAEDESLEIPFWTFDPRVVGIGSDYRRIVNIPGFWPGDKHKFGTLQFLKRGHHSTRTYNDKEDSQEALHRQGILASFSWLVAQANHLGFTMFNDLTYPLVTQTVITNGQLFSFYTYQLNTMLLHYKNTLKNPKRNLCWATEELKLYERVTEDGKFEGFNDEILSKLVKFYANSPCERLGMNLTPFLSKSEKVSADYEDEEKREWLEREYKFIVSNRPRKHLGYEIYNWEKIYKVDHKTRFMDKKLRPFELREHPYQRTYDDRKPRYIPRKLRPHLPKWKGRDAKEYFP